MPEINGDAKIKYADIINMEHPTSKNHPRMTIHNRAAQFRPFRALTGYDASIREQARATEKFVELTEEEKEILNDKLRTVFLSPSTVATITYFEKDSKKDGGAYIVITGEIIRIDNHLRKVVFRDGFSIDVDYIMDVDAAIFNQICDE